MGTPAAFVDPISHEIFDDPVVVEASAVAECDQLRQQLEAAQRDAVEAARSIAASRADGDQLRQQLAAAQSEVQSMMATVAQFEEIRQQLQAAQAELTQSKLRMQQLENENMALMSSVQPPVQQPISVPQPSGAAITAFFRKVGSSEAEARAASELLWNGKSVNDEDCKVIAHLIAIGAMDELEELWLNNNQIGDKGMTALADVLKSSSGVMPKLEKLYLFNNEIGDEGMTALSTALSKGALTSLKDLRLYNNKIGDEGMKSLADALSCGALASLKTLVVDDGALGNEHPQLTAVCSSRGIELR